MIGIIIDLDILLRVFEAKSVSLGTVIGLYSLCWFLTTDYHLFLTSQIYFLSPPFLRLCRLTSLATLITHIFFSHVLLVWLRSLCELRIFQWLIRRKRKRFEIEKMFLRILSHEISLKFCAQVERGLRKTFSIIVEDKKKNLKARQKRKR